MKFGFFDDANKEYVINSPKTPYPWINYLGNQGFFSLISNTAGGYCFYRDAKLQRLLRYRYNAVPGDNGGRSIILKRQAWMHGIPAFCPPEPSWIIMNAAMAWVIPLLTLQRTDCGQK